MHNFYLAAKSSTSGEDSGFCNRYQHAIVVAVFLKKFVRTNVPAVHASDNTHCLFPWHFSFFHMACSCLKEQYMFSLLPELCLSNAIWGDRLELPKDNLNISLIIPGVDATVTCARPRKDVT